MAEPRRRDRMGFLGSLARGLAHEIKNPLSTLTVNLQMLREDLTEPLTSRERRILKRLETLEREVKRSESILNDFVGFARGFKLELHPQPIGRVLEEVVNFFEPEARRHGIQIRTQVDPNLPDVLLDPKYFKQAASNDPRVKATMQNAAINTPIQGTAADMIKLAMIRAHLALRKHALETHMIVQVHDELVFDVAPGESEAVRPLVKESMEAALPLSVPVLVEMGEGRNWLEAH